MNSYRYFLVIAFVLMAQSCNNNEAPNRSPEESIAEITALGITLASNERPFPDEVDQQYFDGDPAYIHAELTWYFSPPLDYSELVGSNISGLLASDFEFEYRFTTLNNNEFITIPSLKEVDEFVAALPPTGYSGIVGISDFASDLIVFGNFNLRGTSVSVPVTATHIELWMRLNRAAGESLVNRVSLENLTAWRLYFKPLIDKEE